jgi:spore germination cell wall hydrolase CwlJ-like protein
MQVISEDTWGALCIFAEARSEPYEGQVAVGNVIRTRMKKKYFSDGTVVDTVTRPYQFSWMNSNDRQRTRCLRVDDADPAWKQAVKAWEDSALLDVVGDAVLYHAEEVHPWWAKAEGIAYVKRIGRHLFFRSERH